MLTFAESGHPAFRSTSPLSRGVLKSQGGGKLSIIFCADPGTIETVFRTILSVNQLSIYGAVAEMCEECDSCHDWTGRLVVEGQSNPLFVPSVMKTHTYLWPMILHKKKIYCKDFENELKNVITTRQSEQILYWCRIPDHSWSRTVFHEERHWIILTIHKFSGLSWVHIAKRRKFIWTKRLDSREHQDWTRIGSHNQLLGK